MYVCVCVQARARASTCKRMRTRANICMSSHILTNTNTGKMKTYLTEFSADFVEGFNPACSCGRGELEVMLFCFVHVERAVHILLRALATDVGRRHSAVGRARKQQGKNWLQKYGNYDREELSTYSCVLWRLMLDDDTRLLAGLENNREKTGFRNMVTMIEKSCPHTPACSGD